MKPYPILAFLVSLLFGTWLHSQSVIATPAEQNTVEFSTGSLVADISSQGEIILHISSPQGYEVRRFADRRRVRNTPGRYSSWTPVNIASRYDFTVIHQQIDSLQARGWELVNSSVSAAVDYSDLNTIYQKELYYQFRVPTALPISVQDANQFTLVVQAEVSTEDLWSLRGRVLKMRDETYQLVVERSLGLGWEVVYQLENEGPVAAALGESITGFTLENNKMSLEYTMPDGVYSYRFWGQPGAYLLREVDFTSAEPCGLTRFTIDFGAYPKARFVGAEREEPCLPGISAKTFRENLDRQEIRLRYLSPGANAVKLDKARKTIEF